MRCNLVLCQESEPQTSVLSWGSYKRNIVQKKKKKNLYFAFVQSMYRNARSPVTISGTFIDNFLVVLYQDSVLSLLLFIIVLEALSRECRLLFPKEPLNANVHWKQWLLKY